MGRSLASWLGRCAVMSLAGTMALFSVCLPKASAGEVAVGVYGEPDGGDYPAYTGFRIFMGGESQIYTNSIYVPVSDIPNSSATCTFTNLKPDCAYYFCFSGVVSNANEYVESARWNGEVAIIISGNTLEGMRPSAPPALRVRPQAAGSNLQWELLRSVTVCARRDEKDIEAL